MGDRQAPGRPPAIEERATDLAPVARDVYFQFGRFITSSPRSYDRTKLLEHARVLPGEDGKMHWEMMTDDKGVTWSGAAAAAAADAEVAADGGGGSSSPRQRPQANDPKRVLFEENCQKKGLTFGMWNSRLLRLLRQVGIRDAFINRRVRREKDSPIPLGETVKWNDGNSKEIEVVFSKQRTEVSASQNRRRRKLLLPFWRASPPRTELEGLKEHFWLA